MSNQVHRFHDTVAAYLGTGETVYMSPAQAMAFGMALIQVAEECDSKKFVDSTIGTFRGETLSK